jgi:signal transduction histidine kinase
MLSSLSSDHYVHRLVLGSWFEQKGILDLWLFAAMTASAILFSARILCVRDWNSFVERSVNWIAIVMVMLVLPAAIWVQAIPILWNLTALVFTVFGVASLIASLRNVYKVRSLKNCLITFAFLFFVASQLFCLCVMLGLLPEAPINQIVWMLVLIISLTLLQVALVIQLFDTRSNNENQQVFKASLNHQTDSHSKYTREQERLHAHLIHDFKTPLAIIDSSVQSLTMLEHEEDPQRTLRYNRIRRAVMRINDLLMGSILTEKNKSNGTKESPSSKLTEKN